MYISCYLRFLVYYSDMKIGLVHSRLLWQGGLETRLFSYMEYLAKLGHDVSVIVYKVGAGVVIPDGVRLIHLNLKNIPKAIRAPVFNYRLKGVVDRGNLDFVLSLTKTSHQDAVLAPGNHLGFLNAIGKKSRSLGDRRDIRLERKAFTSSKVILASSKMMKDELVRFYGIEPEKINVLFPPVDNRRFNLDVKAERQKMREKYGFSRDKKSFVLVSISHSRKGLPLLIEVFKELKDEPYELIVAGVEPVTSVLPNVRYAGFIRETEELYAAADYCILPAKYEPFGQVVAEALLCGVPVLISSMVGAQEIVSGKEGLVIPSLEVKDWVDAIRSLSQRNFEISPDIGHQKGILLEDHMQTILQTAERIKNG